jgi:hypothetical protein
MLRLEPDQRTLPIRRLRPDEVERLGFTGPLQLSRLQVGRFGRWRPTKELVVETPSGQLRMAGTAEELAVYGLVAEPDGGPARDE